MHTMLQRQLGHSGSLSRQASSELPSPAAKSKGVSRSNSFNRRAFGCIPSSRSRPSLLVSCSGPIGPLGGDFTDEHHSPAGPSASASHTPHGAYSHGGPQPLAPPSPQPQPPTWEFSPEPYVPAPANLPAYELDEGIPTGGADPEPLLFFPPRTSASSDASGASAASPTSAAGPSAGFRVPDVFIPPLSASSSSSQPHPQHPQHPQQPLHGGAGSNQVYVILFGVGERDTEGIYSLRAFRPDDGLPHETIIAFECEEEATRYACLLEASMDHTPHVCSIPPRELLSFCLDQTYSCRLEPRGSLLIPPDFNVSVTDWERSLRLREGNSDELADIRARLERLLSQ
eukprot:XP_001692267.1 predicted protein [Chlamydomonas reinhardtii]